MSKLIVIKDCNDCPLCRCDCEDGTYCQAVKDKKGYSKEIPSKRSENDGVHIWDVEQIPNWCPLNKEEILVKKG